MASLLKPSNTKFFIIGLFSILLYKLALKNVAPCIISLGTSNAFLIIGMTTPILEEGTRKLVPAQLIGLLYGAAKICFGIKVNADVDKINLLNFRLFMVI